MLTSTQVGRAGEFFSAFIFELHGILSVHVDLTGIDLWCETPSGRRVGVQVKTASCPRIEGSSHRKYARYTFSQHKGRPSHADLFAFVALDRRCLLVRENLHWSSIKFLPHCFTEEEQNASIARLLF
jgi:hypothetical protein